MNGQHEKLELEIGVPVTVAFAYDQGKLCSKKFPGADDHYARQTKSGHVLFVDAAEEMRLRKSVRAGQAVILCREKTKAGSRYLTIKTAPPALKAPLGVVNGTPKGIPDSKFAQMEPPAPAWEGMQVINAPAPSPTADGGLLGRCLCEALNACKTAQAHAASIGMQMVFTSADVEKMAVSLLIEKTRYGSVAERNPARFQNGAVH